MEKLSINSSKKTLLAVALVIFMLVAFLGVAVFTSNAAFASATDIAISAAFSAESTDAHSDSTTTQRYYNTDSLALTAADGEDPGDTFDVTYTFNMNGNSILGYTIKLNNNTDKFKVVGVKIGDTPMTEDDDYTIDDYDESGVDYMVTNGFQYGTTSVLLITTTEPITELPTVTVTYELIDDIDVFTSETLSITGRYRTSSGNVTTSSNTVAVTVRTAIDDNTVAGTDKTYNASPAQFTSSLTFEDAATGAAVSNPAEVYYTWKTSNGTAIGLDPTYAPIDAGTYQLTKTVVANDYFEGGSVTDSSVTISQLAVTITADDKTSIYSEAIQARTYSFSPAAGSAFLDFADRDAITVTFGGAGNSLDTTSAVGDYTITLSADGTGIGNYAVTTVNGTYTITRHYVAVPTVTIYNNGATTGTTIAAGGSQNVNYNGLVYSFNYAAAEDNAYSGEADPAASKDVDTYTLTLTVGDNYYWGDEPSEDEDLADKVFTYVVNKIPVTVTLGHAAITYRDAVPTSGYTVSASPAGGENIASVSLTQSDFATTYVQYSTTKGIVGTYDISVSGTTKTAIDNLLANYIITYAGTNMLTVNKLGLSAAASWIQYKSGDSATMTYDKSAHGIEAVATAYTFGSTEVCSVALTGGDNSNGTQTHVTASVGNAPSAVTLTATFALKAETNDDKGNLITANYDLDNKVVTLPITINRKAVTIEADDKSTTYGTAAPAFTSNASSALIEGDTYTTTGSIACAYTAEAEDENRVAGSYSIVPSGWANNDYTIGYTNGTLTVNKKVVTFTWSATKTWVYDGSSHTISATVVGAEYDEAITVDGYSGNASATDVGNYSRTVTSLSDDDNYAITDAGTETEAYSITVRTVNVTVTPVASLVYNSDSQVLYTVVVDNLVGTESLTFTYTASGSGLFGSTVVYKNGTDSTSYAAILAGDYTLEFTAIANGTAGEGRTAGKAANYTLNASASSANSIAKYTFTWAAVSFSGNVATWTDPTTIQGEDVITFAYSLTLSETEKLATTSTKTYTATAAGDYTLAVSFSGDRAANYNTIADRTLTVYSVTLTDTAYNHATYGHPHNGAQHASVTKYAFAGQAVPSESAWTVDGYTFIGWFADATDRDSDEFVYSDAVLANATYVASYDVATYQVTYKYTLNSGSPSWITYNTIETAYYTELAATPTIAWFTSFDGWKDNEYGTGFTKTILDVYEDITYYTAYDFTSGTGDVDGDGDVDLIDAKFIRQFIVGGYDVSTGSVNLSSFADAWEAVKLGGAAPSGKFLSISSDTNGDGVVDAFDVTLINQAVAGGYGVTRTNGVLSRISDSGEAKSLNIGAGYDQLIVFRDGTPLSAESVTYTKATGALDISDIVPDTASSTAVVIVIKTYIEPETDELGNPIPDELTHVALIDNWSTVTYRYVAEPSIPE